MAEGGHSRTGCIVTCASKSCGWVPLPRVIQPRRDALIEAVGRSDNPCDRPGRCPPCCKPVPKFRLPKELPACDINCFREEQAAAKMQEYCEKRQKYIDSCCPKCPPPQMEVEILDPVNYPVAVEIPYCQSPEQEWFLKELPCKTNFIVGTFNPNDNKTLEQKMREKCDPFFRECGPCMKTYPCRGVINSPRQVWTNLAIEQRLCFDPPCGCEGSPYLKPEYLAQEQAKRDRFMMQKCMEAELAKPKWEYPHPCCPTSFSQSEYCQINK